MKSKESLQKRFEEKETFEWTAMNKKHPDKNTITRYRAEIEVLKWMIDNYDEEKIKAIKVKVEKHLQVKRDDIARIYQLKEIERALDWRRWT